MTVPVSKRTRRAKGFAHVTFVLPEHAVRAMNQLNGTSFKGRILHIVPSLNAEEDDDEGEVSRRRVRSSRCWLHRLGDGRVSPHPLHSF